MASPIGDGLWIVSMPTGWNRGPQASFHKGGTVAPGFDQQDETCGEQQCTTGRVERERQTIATDRQHHLHEVKARRDCRPPCKTAQEAAGREQSRRKTERLMPTPACRPRRSGS